MGQTFFLIRRPLLQHRCLHSYIPVHGRLSFILSMWEVLDDAINLRDERDAHLTLPTMVVGRKKKGEKKKKEKMKGRKLANPEQSSFELCKGHRGAPIGILQKYTLCCQTVKQAFPLKNIAWILPKNSVRRRTRDNHSPEFSYREAQLPGQGSCSPHLV